MASEGVGKRVGGALYVHRTAIIHLSPSDQALVRKAEAVAGVGEWNVAKLDLGVSKGLSLLVYEDFNTVAFPSLIASHRIDIEAGTVDARKYGKNPPILHRKELMLAPDHLRRQEFAALTKELERRGLFVQMTRRGRKESWLEALHSAGVTVRGHDIHPVAPITATRETPEAVDRTERVGRHRTAIARNALSAPMAALNGAGLLEDGVTVLDYGCGRGDDVRALQAANIDAVGYDPFYAPDRSVLTPRAVVSLGFVLNVVEDLEERFDILRAAFELTRSCLVVSVMLVGKGDVSGLRPHRDGFLTSRGTFQRYYTQAELRTFLLSTLNVTPVAAGPGIFFVFRDEALEQEFLARRQAGIGAIRQIQPLPRPPTVRKDMTAQREAALEPLRDELVALASRFGRAPHSSEVPALLRAALSEARLSMPTALLDAFSAIPEEEKAAAKARRSDAVGRFFALGAFSARPAYKRLAPSLQRDVRAFFGTLCIAVAAGRRMLFEAGDVEALSKDAHEHASCGVGRLVQDKFEVHARDVDQVSPRLRTYIGIAETLAGTLEGTTLFRIHLQSKKLTALRYPDFDTSAMPRLADRTKIDLRTGDVEVFDHHAGGRVSVLIGKSNFMSQSEPRYVEQAAFDRALEFSLGADFKSAPFARVVQTIQNAGLKLPY